MDRSVSTQPLWDRPGSRPNLLSHPTDTSVFRPLACWSHIWSWGPPHALIQAFQSSGFCLGLGNMKKAIPLLNCSGHCSCKWHWPKQQWRAPHFFSAVNNDVPALFTLLLRGRFPVPAWYTCFFMLFYSKCRMWLIGYSDWQAARMCLLHQLIRLRWLGGKACALWAADTETVPSFPVASHFFYLELVL